jgi:ABC-type branched-subunit amino acid transport system substrate-binding protein
MARRYWVPDEGNIDGLLFDGSLELLTLLDDLFRRPRIFRREPSLPLVCLVGSRDADSPIPGIEERLRKAVHGPIPHAKIGPTEPAAVDADPFRQMLAEIVAQLARKTTPSRRRIRFPHFGLATWLLGLPNPESGPDDKEERRIKRALRAHLRNRAGAGQDFPGDESLRTIAADVPWYVRLAVGMLHVFGAALAVSLWRPPKWFGRYRFDKITDIYQLASRLSRFDDARKRGDQVHRLLLDALLEDLRRAYRRGGLFGTGRRRTGYPILLLDDVSGSGTRADFLRLIRDIRNSPDSKKVLKRREVVRWDPLVVVATARDSETGKPNPPTGARPAHQRWQLALSGAGLGGGEWRLEFEISPQGDRNKRGNIETAVQAHGLPVVRRTWSLAIVAGVLASCLVAVPFVGSSTCWSFPWLGSGSELSRVDLDPELGTTQCVGLDHVGSSYPADLQAVLATINAANDVAEQREHITVVYLGALTSRSVDGYVKSMEELKGMAAAQQEYLNLVPTKIVVANAGEQMAHGKFAGERIRDLAKDDETVVAVVGLGLSRRGTIDAIKQVEQAGLIMVGTTVSADSIANASRNFRQIGFNNKREAEVAAFFARTELGANSATIYYSSDSDDLYSMDLAYHVEAEFRDRGIHAEKFDFRAGDAGDAFSPDRRGNDACATHSDVVFYAGRSDEFVPFMKGMKLACGDKYPRVLAADDVTKFVLNQEHADYPGLDLHYLSFASSAAWGANCEDPNPAPFYPILKKLFGDATCGRLRDGQAIGGYDALRTVQHARNIVRSRSADAPVTGGSILDAFHEITDRDGRRGALGGASGVIDFGAQPDRRVPFEKAVLVLKLVGGERNPPTLALFCGDLERERPGHPDCPTE